MVSDPSAASGILVSLGCSLETSAFAFVSIGTGRSYFPHHSSLTEMVGLATDRDVIGQLERGEQCYSRACCVEGPPEPCHQWL